ncbi:hypothetical protein E2542_SST02964 [Spatholobus suberectus]|nr:hypothetical protein E2542_SST02964 [Spatholobus suberectus]
MSNKFNAASEICPENESWKIMVRVIRLWLVSDMQGKKYHSPYGIGAGGLEGFVETEMNSGSGLWPDGFDAFCVRG